MCPKHVEKRNKHTKKKCAPSQLYLQDYTGMHSQQNIKLLEPHEYSQFSAQVVLVVLRVLNTCVLDFFVVTVV